MCLGYLPYKWRHPRVLVRLSGILNEGDSWDLSCCSELLMQTLDGLLMTTKSDGCVLDSYFMIHESWSNFSFYKCQASHAHMGWHGMECGQGYAAVENLSRICALWMTASWRMVVIIGHLEWGRSVICCVVHKFRCSLSLVCWCHPNLTAVFWMLVPDQGEPEHLLFLQMLCMSCPLKIWIRCGSNSILWPRVDKSYVDRWYNPCGLASLQNQICWIFLPWA